MTLIEQALKRGAKALSEHESKLFLSQQGIPITREKIVSVENEAVKAAAEIGYPVVLKGSGEDLSHKSELGLVEVDLRNDAEVRTAYQRLTGNRQVRVREVLVQQMVKGDRELMAGLIRDSSFGPCVMFGLGGIFAEVLHDTAFRLAPLTRAEALEMLQDIRGKKILGPVRGKSPADLNALADLLIAVGEIGVRYEQIREIDINPIKLPDGKPVAVDALIVLKSESRGGK